MKKTKIGNKTANINIKINSLSAMLKAMDKNSNIMKGNITEHHADIYNGG